MKVKIPATQALKLFWETEEPNASSQHPAKTAECPSYGQFEAHANGKKLFNSTQLEHVNQCPYYCQKNLSLFRKHCGVSLRAIGAEAIAWIREWLTEGLLQPMTFEFFKKGEVPPRIYMAVAEDEDGQVAGEGRVIITQGPFLTEDGCLVLGINVTEPQFPIERRPIQLSLVSLADEQSIYTFELQDLEEQLLKTKLPEYLLAQATWQQIEATDNLPFGFVLRAFGKELTLAKSAFWEVASNGFPRSESTVYGVSRVDNKGTHERQVERRFAFPVGKRLARVACVATS